MKRSLFVRLEHRLYIERKKLRLKNKNPTLISSNCNGAFILHDLGCRFNSPTVNLYINASDFLKMISDPRKYFQAVPVEVKSSLPFPVGRVEDITVYFMHYSSFDDAKEKWIVRSARADLNHFYVMMTDRNGCTEADVLAFDALPIKHKVIFTHKPYPEIKSAFYIPGFENNGEVGVLSDWKPGFWKRRWLDDFDYVSFLNEE